MSRVAAGDLGFLCRYHREIRELLVLPQGSQVSIRVVSESAGVLWIHGRGIRPQFPWEGESQGVSLVATGSVGSLSCHRDLREPLMLSLRSQESVRVARGLLGFLSSWCRGLGLRLELRRETQVSSPALTGISGFLWRFHWRVKRCLVLGHGTPLPSPGGKGVSGSYQVEVGIMGYF